MYIPPAFQEARPEVLQEIMQRFSFATLVTDGDGGLTATHVPLSADLSHGEHGILLGHLARANPQWHHFVPGAQALAIFQGPHAYVSPSWYEADQAVPTWNYVAIHAYGTPEIVEDARVVRAYLETMVRTYEVGKTAWKLETLSEEYLRGLMRGIVFFQIPIHRLEGKFKLNQNRGKEDRRGVITALAQSGDSMQRELSDLMRRMCLGPEG